MSKAIFVGGVLMLIEEPPSFSTATSICNPGAGNPPCDPHRALRFPRKVVGSLKITRFAGRPINLMKLSPPKRSNQAPRETVVPIGTLVVTVTADRVPAAADYVLDLPLPAQLVPHQLDAQAAGRSENRLTGVFPVPLHVVALTLKSAARRRQPSKFVSLGVALEKVAQMRNWQRAIESPGHGLGPFE